MSRFSKIQEWERQGILRMSNRDKGVMNDVDVFVYEENEVCCLKYTSLLRSASESFHQLSIQKR